MADVSVGAVGRVELAAAGEQLGDLTFERGELLLPLADLVELRLGE